MDEPLSAVPASLPSPTQFGMQARVEAPSQVELGDTIELSIHVTWTDAPHPWLLLPQTSPESAKITQLGMAMEQTRTIVNGKESPEILIRYHLLAKDTGTAHIPALTFDIPVQEGGAMHLVTVPSKIDIQAPIQTLPWIAAASGFFIISLMVLLIWKRRSNRKAATQAAKAKDRELRKAFETLADRVQSADPRGWMIELEAFMQQIPPEKRNAEQIAAQQKLKEAFAQSRYGGGPRDSWELKEWLRTAREALQFNRDNQEE